MELTPDVLRAAYHYLSQTEPFCEWKLPYYTIVQFEVIKDTKLHGFTNKQIDDRPYLIAISDNCHKHTLSLMLTMAHEMIHVYLHSIKYRGWNNEGPKFKELAKRVCDSHGFDPGQF